MLCNGNIMEIIRFWWPQHYSQHPYYYLLKNEREANWMKGNNFFVVVLFVFSQTTASNENIRMHSSGSWSLLFPFTCMWMFDGFACYNWTATFRVVRGRCVSVRSEQDIVQKLKIIHSFLFCDLFSAHVKANRLLVRTCLITWSPSNLSSFSFGWAEAFAFDSNERRTSKAKRFIIMRAHS